METFMQPLKAGKVAPEEMDNFIDAWRNDPTDSSLLAFLGMTPEEYASWVKSPNLQEWLKTVRTLAI